MTHLAIPKAYIYSLKDDNKKFQWLGKSNLIRLKKKKKNRAALHWNKVKFKDPNSRYIHEEIKLLLDLTMKWVW